MTLWIDNRGQLKPGEPATHVVIIGTSRYRHLPGGSHPAPEDVPTLDLGQLQCACLGAAAFARWLRDHYHDPVAPLATIRLLLAPSDDEIEADLDLARAAGGCDLPTRANVQRALDDWERDCRNNPRGVAILFASGHGIELTREDQTVLLHDFAETRLIANNTLEVGFVFRGMAGAEYPQRQCYFVDTCRSQPEELTRWSELGAGVRLAALARVADRRCAPIFSAAAPGTTALGRRGKGTIFSTALLECLAGLAADPDEEGCCRVTVYSLAAALNRRVEQLAAECGLLQDVNLYGAVNPGVLHAFRSTPEVDYTFEIRPGVAHCHASADLWDDARRTPVFSRERFSAPELVRPLAIGTYRLDVGIDPGQPFVARPDHVCVVRPQGRKVINVEA